VNKKKQKTLIFVGGGAVSATAHYDKSFLVLFFKKELLPCLALSSIDYPASG
jgi:hypothetical protein